MKSKKKNALFGRYPSCDMLNNALRFMRDGQTKIACEEIIFAIEKADGYFHEDIVPFVQEVRGWSGEQRGKDEATGMRRYIDAEKVIEELSKVPWYNREDEKQAVRIVREFSTVGICRSDECENKKDTFFQGWAWNNFNTAQHTGCVENALNEVSE